MRRKRRVYLTPKDKKELVNLYKNGTSIIDLALKTGATVRTIYNIISKY